MKSINFLLLIVGYLSLVMFFAPVLASAQIVPQTCSGLDCTFCDLLGLVKNVIDWMIRIGLAVGGLFIAVGAFVIMMAGGSEQKISEGRKMITVALTGIAIMLASWLIVGTFLKVVSGDKSLAPWKTIDCRVNPR